MNASYKDKLIYALIKELSSKSDTSESTEYCIIISADIRYDSNIIYIINGYISPFVDFDVTYVYNGIQTTAPPIPHFELYENDVLIYTAEEEGYNDVLRIYIWQGLRYNEQTETGPFHEGCNTYYAKDKKTGICSNKYKINVVKLI